MHIWQDVFYPEVINSDTGMPVKEGEFGELVFTTLTKQGVPLLRYRTRDIVTLNYETCKCGRTAPRMSKVRGRTDDMIIVRGINVFPSQIEHVLLKIEGILPHYQLVVERAAGGLDDLEVVVEVDEKTFSDEVRKMEGLKTKIKKDIESLLGVLVKVKLVEPKTIERSMGKAKRVIDKRTI
jgi:phenylacetate-CoA ligase